MREWCALKAHISMRVDHGEVGVRNKVRLVVVLFLDRQLSPEDAQCDPCALASTLLATAVDFCRSAWL